MTTGEGRSGYRPAEPIQIGPPLNWPPRPVAILKWVFRFPGFLWPWPALFFGFALLSWLLFAPGTSEDRNFSPGRTALLLAINFTLLLAFVGALHLRLYVQRSQGSAYKYNSRWLSVGNRSFLFGSQLWDNVFWSVCSAVPIWTGYELLTFWLQANGFVPTISWRLHPVYCAVLAVLLPVWLDTHFYLTHRLIHWAPLYRWVHYLHHKNVNIGPWSGVAMHPLEHLIYFSAVVLLWLVPSHPLHTVYLLIYLALGSAVAHSGFHQLLFGAKSSLNTDHYWHYLHHKYVHVNYGGDLLPLDQWFGTLHDGSEQAQVAMKKRVSERARRVPKS